MRTLLHRTRIGSTCSSYALHTHLCSVRWASHTTPTVTLRGRTRKFHTLRKHPSSGKTEFSCPSSEGVWNRTFQFQALHHTIKRSVWQLTRKKQATPLTTSPNKLLNNNHVTTTGKNAKHRNATCAQAIWTTNIFPNHASVTQETSTKNTLD